MVRRFEHSGAGGAFEPLGWVVRNAPAPPGFDGLDCRRFELASRGDVVPGRLLLPSTPAPHPLVLLQHGAGGSADAEYMQACAPWVRGGAAVASIDFPLHGARWNAKLAAQLLGGADAIGGPPAKRPDPSDALLWVEFARQAITDLGRTLDALADLPEIDAARIGYAGFSLGGMLGALFCAEDDRPRAVALALAGGGFGPAEIDPCTAVPRIAPRPLLMVNARDDRTIPAEAVLELFRCAGEPKRLEWFDADHSSLPGRALKAMWTFLGEHLEIRG